MNDFEIGAVRVGPPSLFLIAGPCVIESEVHARFMADAIQRITADLGLPNADQLKIKSGLAMEIARAIRRLRLTQEEAGRRMGIPQPKVSNLLRGDFANLSERKLMECLNRLGYNIEIKLTPATEPIGRRILAVA